MAPKDKYTDPKLRDEVKEEIHQSDKGGKPGQWSARKAQMMASEYKKRGGSYNTTKEEGQSESQKNLDKWSKEEWQTKEGSGTAKKSDGTRKRYLPKEAWEEMSEDEKEETEEKKVKESKEGKQFVGNTAKAKSARKNASKESSSEGEQSVEDGDKPRTRRNTRNAVKKQHDEGKNGEKKGSGSKRSAEQSKASNKRAKNRDEESGHRGKEDEKTQAQSDEGDEENDEVEDGDDSDEGGKQQQQQEE